MEREARSAQVGGRRCRGLRPTACRRFLFGSLRSSSAAGWRQGDHLRTNPIKLRPEHQRRHQAHHQKSLHRNPHIFYSEKLLEAWQSGHERRGVGGRGCFVATVLLTVCVNLLHYPLNPHLAEQKFTASVFSIKFAGTGSLLQNKTLANISCFTSVSHLRRETHWD